MVEKRQIRAVYNDTTVRVYQAYSPLIADEAIRIGTFGSHFKVSRMTWIKPSFLWMMYRSGWATKDGQERILAINIKRTAFDYLIKNAVLSKYSNEINISELEWKDAITKTDIICQWDPERDINGKALEYRSLQIGIRGKAILNYVEDWIVSIEDITEHVKTLLIRKSTGIDISNELPKEKIYEF